MNTWIIGVPLHLHPSSTSTPPPYPIGTAHGFCSFHAPYISRSKRERTTYHIGVQLTETFGCIKAPKGVTSFPLPPLHARAIFLRSNGKRGESFTCLVVASFLTGTYYLLIGMIMIKIDNNPRSLFEYILSKRRKKKKKKVRGTNSLFLCRCIIRYVMDRR